MKTKVSNRAIAVFAGLLGLSLAVTAAGIAGMNQQGTSKQGPESYNEAADAAKPQKVDDATLKRAATAYVKVREVSLNARKALGNANNDTVKQRIVAKAQSDQVAAVKRQGMGVQQYNDIIMLVQANTGVQKKFLSYVQQAEQSHGTL